MATCTWRACWASLAACSLACCLSAPSPTLAHRAARRRGAQRAVEQRHLADHLGAGKARLDRAGRCRRQHLNLERGRGADELQVPVPVQVRLQHAQDGILVLSTLERELQRPWCSARHQPRRVGEAGGAPLAPLRRSRPQTHGTCASSVVVRPRNAVGAATRQPPERSCRSRSTASRSGGTHCCSAHVPRLAEGEHALPLQRHHHGDARQQ